MRYSTLKELGAREIEPLHYGAARAKSHGYMWGGHAVLQLGTSKYHFDLWHHGGDEMSPQEAAEHIPLKGIETPSKYYDIHWHALLTNNEIWLHPKGWFHSSNEEQARMEYIRRRTNYNIDRTPDDFSRDMAVTAGFYLLISRSIVETITKFEVPCETEEEFQQYVDAVRATMPHCFGDPLLKR